jgi:DNA processing protein
MQLIQTKIKNKTLLYISISQITFLSFEEKKKLAKNLDSYNDLALLFIEDISLIIQRKISSRAIWNGEENRRKTDLIAYYCEKLNIGMLFYFDDKYPKILLNCSDPPFLLYFRGNPDVLSGTNVSVVGTRRLTSFGRKAAIEFSYDASMDGVNVVSGLAIGCDSAAHIGALDAYYDCFEREEDCNKVGRTIAVLPCAADDIVPSSNKRLAQKIIESGGCLISEYEPTSQIANWHFVQRNRIIAGLSQSTVVIEAPVGSGALITVDYALDMGRDVMFHKVSFNDFAEQISKKSKDELELKYMQKKVSKFKVENSPKKFVDDGAPVIINYKDYCSCLLEIPGRRNITN